MGYILMTGGSSTGLSEECTAERKHVLIGHSAVTSDSEDDIVDGTMPNNGIQNGTLLCGETFEIPQGYTDGGIVAAADLVSQTGATAEVSDVRAGETFWKDGVKNTGTLADKGAWSSSGLAAGESVAIPAGIHDGTGKVTAKSLKDQTWGTLDAAKMLSGIYGYSDGERVEGTMPDVQAYDPASSVVANNSAVYMRMTNGAHITNGSSGYPEVYAYRSAVAKAIELTADKLLRGKTVLGVKGTGRQKVKQLGDDCFYGFGSTDTDGRGPYDASFTLPSDGVVYYSGGSASYAAGNTVTCEIYKNGSIVDSRNIDASNTYTYRGTMVNKSFTVSAGDVVRVRVGTTASSHSVAFLFATIVYDD